MTKPTDIDKDIAATSRGRSRRKRSAGGKRKCRQPPAQCSGVDEDARRSHGKSALRDALAVREGCYQKYSKESVAVSIRVWTDAAAGSRRHNHAERIVL